MRWAEITADCPAESVDAVSYAFIEAGCGGVVIREGSTVSVQASLPVSDELSGKLESLRDHFQRLPEFGLAGLAGPLTVRYAEDEDWANAWKKYFKPLRLGNRIVIKPSWEEFTPGPEDLVLELDPGMAFGTGGHPTTQLCITALEETVRPGMRIADIGTGSGILAIAAARLGATKVFATDIDPLPRRVARENVARNELAATIEVLEMDEFDAAAMQCDLVVANIVANTIIDLAPAISRRLNAGGTFIASGIVEEHHDLVSGALGAAGLTVWKTLREDIWVCLIAERTAETPADTGALEAAARELPPLPG